jgi:hypothetical protein
MNQFGRVAAYLSNPYWCVHSAQCTTVLSLIMVIKPKHVGAF